MGRARMRAILPALRAALAGLLLVVLLPFGLLITVAATPPAAAARALAAQPGPPAPEAARPAAAGPGADTPVAVQAGAATPPQSWPPLAWHRPLQPGREAMQGELQPPEQGTGTAADRQESVSAPSGTVLLAAIAATIPLQPAPSAASGPATPAEAVVGSIREREQQATASPLQRRLQQWPAWRLPAPLPRPGRQAPVWPAWFSGAWLVETTPLPLDAAAPPQPSPSWRARFRPDGHGGAVAERACNALAVGRSLLGEQLLSVQDDPRNPQRQLARLAGDRLLETTLIGQRGERPQPDRFLNDELSLEVLHGPGEPRLSRIETLGRWQLLADGSIDGEQWQGRYPSPADGLTAAALTSEHWRVRLVPVPPGSDRALQTPVPAADCH